MIKKRCERCGKMTYMTGATQKYCNRCYGLITQPERWHGVCEICGQEYEKTRINQKYCGPDCADIASKSNKKYVSMQRRMERKKEESAKREMRIRRKKSRLDEKIEIANNLGISYGELQARLLWANIPPIDTRIGKNCGR